MLLCKPGEAPMTPHHILQKRITTPLGEMLAARSQVGLSGLWFEGQKHHPGALDLPVAPWDPVFKALETALQGYFAGAALPPALLAQLDPVGTPFQMEVWRALLQIESGQSESYGAIAKRIGRPQAMRAIGGAVGRNPLSILIPCHRVLGADGRLTGYAGGLERKLALLQLEAANLGG